MRKIEDLRIRLFSDGADLASILEMYSRPWIRGFTTNPTLMRRAGVCDYELFARMVLQAVPDRPISFEVFADDEAEMERQALAIATWGSNVNVKIPVTNRGGVFLGPLIRRLSAAGVALNVTAILTLEQVAWVAESLAPDAPAIISVFAGRIADTGMDPVPLMAEAKRMLRMLPDVQLLWASPRELLNVFQANEAGCDIITVPPEILRKLDLVGKDLAIYSRETVEMFHRDARAAAYRIDTTLVAARSAGRPVGEDDLGSLRKLPNQIIGGWGSVPFGGNGV
jgi:transaldolase